MIAECIICAYDMDNKQRVPSLSACGHNSMCSLCTLRIRALHRNVNCVTCKRELDHVICSDKPDAKFEDYPMWGDSIGPEFVLDQKSQMFFPTQYYKDVIQKLWVHKCKICSHTFRDIKALRAHVSGEHNMHICLHCVENKFDFPAEQRVYTQKQYETHLREGDQDGSQGHPNCEFCRKRYYDANALFVHLSKDHYTCHLCEKNGVKFKYYKDYKNMEDHFRKAHLLCDDPVCLAKKFMVFDNEIDMEVHNRKYHPTFAVKRASTIKLDFKLARNSNNSNNSLSNYRGDEDVRKMDGSATEADDSNFNHSSGASGRYEGGMGGRANNGEWQVELQPISADPRDINRNAHIITSPTAMTIDPHTSAIQEEFPTLQGSSTNSGGSITLTNKWVSMGTAPTSGGARRPKKADFPALQSSKKVTLSSKLGGGNSGVSSIQKEYDSLSNTTSGTVGTSSRSVSSSLGDWARIKTDNKKVGGGIGGKGGLHNHSTASASTAKTANNYTKTAYSNVRPAVAGDYEESLAMALAESLSDAYRAPAPPHTSINMVPNPANTSAATAVTPPPAPVPVYTASTAKPYTLPPPPPQSVEAFPTLSTTTSATTNNHTTSTINKGPAKKKAPVTAGGWGEALQAVGISSQPKGPVAKKKLTVIKALTSVETKTDASISSSANVKAAVNWDNMKPMTKNNDDEYRIGSGKTSPVPVAASASAKNNASASASTTTSSANDKDKKYGGWVKLGGATNGSVPSQVDTSSALNPEYPSLGGSKRGK